MKILSIIFMLCFSISIFAGPSFKINSLEIESAKLASTICHYVIMSDGHEYIILISKYSTGSDPEYSTGYGRGGVATSSSIIHAVGCKKCLENKKENKKEH